MFDRLVIVLLLALKYLLPVGIVFFPFWAGWANFILDSIDGDLLIPRGLPDAAYQPIDKLADWCTYAGMAIAAWHLLWPVRKSIYGLLALRTIGQGLFFITQDERVFFFFPNFLEPFFLIYASIAFFKRARAADTYKKWRWAIWPFVIVYKVQDEYVTHIGNIDRSDLIKGLLGL